MVTITGAIRRVKLQSNHQQINTQLFTDQCPSCHPPTVSTVRALKECYILKALMTMINVEVSVNRRKVE